ncbi:MAG: hypothetical protein HOV68_33735 [Streptomycetaceae bacterium]|nr:hypothetical protein [Streptomycetaceae bacterium]
MERPPGWPHGVQAPGSDAWVRSAVNWLLDLCPPGYRRHEVLRRHPQLLARLARHHVTAQVMAARAGYGTVRVDMRDHGVQVVEAALQVYEVEGAQLAALEREVALVERALLDAGRSGSARGATRRP